MKMRDRDAKAAGEAPLAETRVRSHRRAAWSRPWGRTLLVFVAALALAAATALPADGQARRTRPDTAGSSGGSSAGSGSGSVSRSPSGTTTGPRTRSSAPDRRSSGPVQRTRPPRGSSGGGAPVIVDDDRRPPGGSYRPGYGYRYPYYGYWDPYWSSYRYSWWLGYWGWYGWNPYPYAYGYPHHGYPHRYGYGYGRVAYYPGRVREDMGALDLDLKPGDTQIYVNGQLIGEADRFDGWPQYLWLEEGDYHFIFYKEGRRAIVREYRVYPGVVIDVEDRLERGESPPPEELFPPPTVRREERLRRYEEQRRRAEAEDADDWRRRSERIRERPPTGYGGEGAAPRSDGAMDQGRAEAAPAGTFGSLELSVVPEDASVYLDGRFLGTGADLARLRRGLTVDAGRHTLSVVRPGYEPEETEIDVEAGEAIRLDLRLERRATQD